MKALLLSEYKRLEIADMPDPDVGPGDVLVRVRAAAICGSDAHGYDGSSGRRIPPIVMGHEAAGVVEAVGNGETLHQIDHIHYCLFERRGGRAPDEFTDALAERLGPRFEPPTLLRTMAAEGRSFY